MLVKAAIQSFEVGAPGAVVINELERQDTHPRTTFVARLNMPMILEVM